MINDEMPVTNTHPIPHYNTQDYFMECVFPSDAGWGSIYNLNSVVIELSLKFFFCFISVQPKMVKVLGKSSLYLASICSILLIYYYLGVATAICTET